MRVVRVARAAFRNGHGNRSYVVTGDEPLREVQGEPTLNGLRLMRAFYGTDFAFDLSQRLGTKAMQIYGPAALQVPTPDSINQLLDSLTTPFVRLTDGPLGVVYVELNTSVPTETVKALWTVPGVSRAGFVTQETLAALLTPDTARILYPNGSDNKFVCVRLEVDADLDCAKSEIHKVLTSC